MSDANISGSPTLHRRLREDVLPPLLILACVLAAWQLAVRIFDIPPWLLPAPSDIVDRFFKTTTLWYHTAHTVLEALAGFLISAGLGIALSAGIVHSRFLERGVFPYVIVSNAIPIIAIIPLLTIWFGFGIAPKIMICAIISLALVGAVVAEFYSSDVGLGYLIITSATQLRTDLLFVAIVVLAVLGVGSFMLFGHLERKVTRGERTEET
jgi:ABC-type nitrate/sulfonate/bicarbonate transport system permease component